MPSSKFDEVVDVVDVMDVIDVIDVVDVLRGDAASAVTTGGRR